MNNQRGRQVGNREEWRIDTNQSQDWIQMRERDFIVNTSVIKFEIGTYSILNIGTNIIFYDNVTYSCDNIQIHSK